MHTDIVLKHDEEHRWCLDCHDADDRDLLHLASGERVPFDESYRLCGQCHGEKLPRLAGRRARPAHRRLERRTRSTCSAPTATTRTSRASSRSRRSRRPCRPPRPGSARRPRRPIPMAARTRGDANRAPRLSRRQFASLRRGGRGRLAPDRLRPEAGCTRCRRSACSSRSRELEREYSEQLRHRRHGGRHAGRCRASCSPTRSTSRAASAAGAASTRASRRTTSRATRRSTGSGCSQMDKEKGVDFTHADPYYQPAEVPEEGHFYVPVACQQCRNPPCTKVCPTGATWTEPDGIVVIDYDWCIGCRYCMAACPYGARHFNWGEPSIPTGELNPNTHVPRQPAAAEGRRREVHVLHPADARRPLPGLRRGLPGRARGSSATCSTPRARSATSSSTSACSC